MDPRATREKVLDQLAARNRTAIPQQDNGATQLMEQLLEQLHHFLSSESMSKKATFERGGDPSG
jgi:hypothetical protein